MNDLVLSVFPGVDLLGRAFEEAGYCVVRGPDVIWGGDVHAFHPPGGVFEGVIGGPPCQAFSTLAHLVRHNGHEPRFGNLIPEYERCVAEAHPRWFVMEEVPAAPVPDVEGYDRWSCLLVDAHVGGLQPRERRISFGMRAGLWTEPLRSPLSLIEYTEGGANLARLSASTDAARRKHSVVADARQGTTGDRVRHVVTAGHGNTPAQRDKGAGSVLSIEDACEAMGLPRDFTAMMPFTMHGKRSAIGNGVTLAMGRAIAAMVRRAAR